jgi:hypothetical protein
VELYKCIGGNFFSSGNIIYQFLYEIKNPHSETIKNSLKGKWTALAKFNKCLISQLLHRERRCLCLFKNYTSAFGRVGTQYGSAKHPDYRQDVATKSKLRLVWESQLVVQLTLCIPALAGRSEP